jgi:hypothetical protein
LNIKTSLALILASVPGIFGSQIALTPSNVIGFNGDYTVCPCGPFPASSILDHQTGQISEPSQDSSYWLNSDNGPANAYIVIDLGAAYNITSFDLFNTHNAHYGDRGTGQFTIEAGNAIGPGVGTGLDLSGPVVTLVNGTLSAANPVLDPLVDQSFTSIDPGYYQYIRFSPHSVATSNNPCCGANVYGLNELRAFGTEAPEPMPMALLGFGLAGLGLLRKRTV